MQIQKIYWFLRLFMHDPGYTVASGATGDSAASAVVVFVSIDGR